MVVKVFCHHSAVFSFSFCYYSSLITGPAARLLPDTTRYAVPHRCAASSEDIMITSGSKQHFGQASPRLYTIIMHFKCFCRTNGVRYCISRLAELLFSFALSEIIWLIHGKHTRCWKKFHSLRTIRLTLPHGECAPGLLYRAISKEYIVSIRFLTG